MTQKASIELSTAHFELFKEQLAQGLILRFPVLSPSMHPFLQVGDVVSISSTPHENLPQGGIYAYWKPSLFLVHRLVRSVQHDGFRSFIFRGDRNRGCDFPVHESAILGRVIEIQRDGSILKHPSFRWTALDFCSRLSAKLFSVSGGLHILLHEIVAATQHMWPFRPVYLWCYKFGLFLLLRKLRRIEGIRAIYLRRSMARNDLLPGVSDIDIMILLEQVEPIGKFKAADKISQCFERYRVIFPFISSPSVMTQAEFKFWRQFGGYRAIEVKQWHCLFGIKEEIPRMQNFPILYQLDLIKWLKFYLNELCEQTIKTLLSPPIQKLSCLKLQRIAADVLFHALVLSSPSKAEFESPNTRLNFLHDLVQGKFGESWIPAASAALSLSRAELLYGVHTVQTLEGSLRESINALVNALRSEDFLAIQRSLNIEPFVLTDQDEEKTFLHDSRLFHKYLTQRLRHDFQISIYEMLPSDCVAALSSLEHSKLIKELSKNTSHNNLIELLCMAEFAEAIVIGSYAQSEEDIHTYHAVRIFRQGMKHYEAICPSKKGELDWLSKFLSF